MSKSGIRLLTLVVLLGGVLVGALALVGVRATHRHARRTPGGAHRQGPAFAVEPSSDPRPSSEVPASQAPHGLLPTIAAAQLRGGANVASGATGESTPGAAATVARADQPTERHLAPDSRQVAMRRQFEAVLARHPSVELAFVNCEESDCRVRAEARDMANLKAFVRDARTLSWDYKIHIETHSSAFNGTSYRADLEGPPPASSPTGSSGG